MPKKKNAIVCARASSFCPNAFPYSNYQICRSRREQNAFILGKLNVLILITNVRLLLGVCICLSVCPLLDCVEEGLCYVRLVYCDVIYRIRTVAVLFGNSLLSVIVNGLHLSIRNRLLNYICLLKIILLYVN